MYLIEVRSHHNLNGVMQIVSGLHSSAIYRLKQTWDAVSEKVCRRVSGPHSESDVVKVPRA
jgi:hypothetical protein